MQNNIFMDCITRHLSHQVRISKLQIKQQRPRFLLAMDFMARLVLLINDMPKGVFLNLNPRLINGREPHGVANVFTPNLFFFQKNLLDN
ncbi:hypothetical protein STSP2_02271 [Anaerohalosphaera lusitana]|uniref:Uncharacterized protein n=1 Tax=Anaerohalosphaera lusitana TaxID=1936003 RepID=A0A1U9NMM7_9BACT|nr:hypothetical protein STSP2_02271 [Anaerohalosphaera lusitana]